MEREQNLNLCCGYTGWRRDCPSNTHHQINLLSPFQRVPGPLKLQRYRVMSPSVTKRKRSFYYKDPHRITVISIGRSPRTSCAPTSSDAFRAARNCKQSLIKEQSQKVPLVGSQRQRQIPHHRKAGQRRKITWKRKPPREVAKPKQFGLL